MQQDGRIETFNVVLLDPNTDLEGYVGLHGSAEQLAAVRASEDFRRMLADATLIVDDVRLIEGAVNTRESLARWRSTNRASRASPADRLGASGNRWRLARRGAPAAFCR